MANFYELPDDLFGFSIEELRAILAPVKRITRARLTNREFSYDGSTDSFKIKGVGGSWRLVAPSKKKLDQAWFQIKEALRKREVVNNEPSNL